jgi:plastocyanin
MACQGEESDENTAGAPTIQLKADPSGAPRFLRTSFFAKPGKATIEFTNESSAAHNVTVVGPVTMKFTNNSPEPIEGPDTQTEATETITNSSTSVVVDLEKPDEDQGAAYYFYCSVDGHEAAGMKGLIIVND